MNESHEGLEPTPRESGGVTLAPGGLARGLRQQLESLHRAGVTSIPVVKSPLADQDETGSAEIRAAMPIESMAVGQPPPPIAAASLPKNAPAAKTAVPNRTQTEVASPMANTRPANTMPQLNLGGASRTAANAMPAAERPAALQVIAAEAAGCTRCAELVANRTQTVFGVGSPMARLCFLGEAPGADEDRQGIPFIGAAGQLLTKIIEGGLKMRREDVYILNICKCRPPGNRQPTPEEAANCRGFLDAQLRIIRPEFICCLGATAAQNLLGTTQAIGRMRGRAYEHGASQVIVTYHPAYLLRNPAAKKDVWDDMKLLLRAMGLPAPD